MPRARIALLVGWSLCLQYSATHEFDASGAVLGIGLFPCKIELSRKRATRNTAHSSRLAAIIFKKDCENLRQSTYCCLMLSDPYRIK